MEERKKPVFGPHEAVDEQIRKIMGKDKAAGGGPVPEKPMPEALVTEEPVPEQPVSEEPVPEEPVPEEPVPEEPVPEEPLSEKPVPEEPVPGKPIPEEPVRDKPDNEEPVPEKPSSEKHDRQPGEKPKREEPTKKSNHVTGKAVGAAVLLLAVLGGSFGLGLGGNSRGDQGGSGTTPPGVTQEVPNQATEAPTEIPATQEPTQPTVETTTAEEGVLIVTVRENQIEYGGRSVTLEELEQALLADRKEGDRIRLDDDHAIKSVYDEVTALLEKLKMPMETAAP